MSTIDALRREIVHTELQRGLDYWCRLRGDRAFPSRSDLDPLDIPHLLPTVSLIDIFTDPLDFRFRLIGTRPAGSTSARTGQSVFDIPEREGRERIVVRYRRCLTERRPVLDTYQCTAGDGIRRVEAVTCPLSDDDVTINMMLSFGLGEPVTPTHIRAYCPRS